MSDNVRTPFTRVFTIENMAGPANPPAYQGRMRATSITAPFGDRTAVREPDPDRYGAFRVVDAIEGEPDLPSLSLEGRYQRQLSDLLRMGRIGCPLDIQIHIGECEDPTDFNGGWATGKVAIIESAKITSWSPNEFGALSQGEDANILETAETQGLDFYEVGPIQLAELGEATIAQEVVAVTVCDSVSCGFCGIPSDGCSVFFAITLNTGGSPGLGAQVVYSEDAGSTLASTDISTLGATNDPSGSADCVGTRLVVPSNEDGAIHYATIADILDAAETWVRNAGGLNASGDPNAIWSAGTQDTWVVGDGGYIYYYSDITADAATQDAGNATGQNLNDVHGIDDQNVMAVGNSNAVVFTTNGGETWASVTGPAVGVNLNACWMHTERQWFVGDANGQLWYTRDQGDNWTEKTFPGSGAGQVRDIYFATPSVGYMAHDIAGPAGRVLRTIDGGFSWYVLPEGTGAITANDRINSVAACGEDPNRFFAGGLDDDASDGILIKGSG